MTGLIDFLKKAFYPRFKFNKDRVRAVDNLVPNKRRRAAIRHGQSVDRILTMVASGVPCRLNPEVKLIMDYLREKRLTLNRTQLTCTFAGITTRLDLEVKTEDGRYAILEIKSGFRGYYEMPHSSRRFNAPFEHMEDSMKNIHLLQLLFTVNLYTRAHRLPVDISSCAILVVNEELTAIHPSDEDVARAGLTFG